MSSFIKKSHVGFACLHYVDEKDWIRWAIDPSWSAVGTQTLTNAWISAVNDLETHGTTVGDAVRQGLAERLVKIVADPEHHPHIPGYSYALMEALGVRCYIVIAHRASLQLLEIREIPGTPAEADQLLDEMSGGDAVRTRRSGSGDYEVDVPAHGLERGLTADELALSLPRELAKDLAAKLASLNSQGLTPETAGEGRTFRASF